MDHLMKKKVPQLVGNADDETKRDKKKAGKRFKITFGHDDEEQKIEWFDDPDKFRHKCKHVAKCIREASGRVVVYTGAGISTSAKLPDYRGTDGMWTHRDAGTTMDTSKYVKTISSALPTMSHMAIATLMEKGLVSSVVSTNVDGLHMRSGIDSKHLTELHGNSYLEICQNCGARYMRDVDVLQGQTEEHRLANRHWCGHYCEKPGCNGLLLDTIVAFGENLPTDELEKAVKFSKNGKLALVLGTTMMVQPACLLPEYVCANPGGKMIICNLQKTPYDSDASLLVRGHLDDFFHLLMQELRLPIPEFKLPASGTTFVKIPWKYEDRIDKKHREKIEENDRKMKELREARLSVAQRNSNALTRGENPYQRSTITNESNESATLSLPSLELLFISKCTDCDYIVTDRCKKVVIESCRGLNLTIKGKILTECLEIINSSNVRVRLETRAGTVTCDKCDDIALDFASSDHVELIAWAQVRNATMVVDGREVDLSGLNAVNYEKDQVLTKKMDTGAFASTLPRKDAQGRIVGQVPI